MLKPILIYVVAIKPDGLLGFDICLIAIFTIGAAFNRRSRVRREAARAAGQEQEDRTADERWLFKCAVVSCLIVALSLVSFRYFRVVFPHIAAIGMFFSFAIAGMSTIDFTRRCTRLSFAAMILSFLPATFWIGFLWLMTRGPLAWWFGTFDGAAPSRQCFNFATQLQTAGGPVNIPHHARYARCASDA